MIVFHKGLYLIIKKIRFFRSNLDFGVCLTIELITECGKLRVWTLHEYVRLPYNALKCITVIWVLVLFNWNAASLFLDNMCSLVIFGIQELGMWPRSLTSCKRSWASTWIENYLRDVMHTTWTESMIKRGSIATSLGTNGDVYISDEKVPTWDLESHCRFKFIFKDRFEITIVSRFSSVVLFLQWDRRTCTWSCQFVAFTLVQIMNS